MTGLVLKLSANERVLVNGAVIQNGGRRSQIHIMTPGAKILRLRDAIHPDDVDTPVKRSCYLAQLVLSGDLSFEDARSDLAHAIGDFRDIFKDVDSRSALSLAQACLDKGDVYKVLRSLRKLIPMEGRILSFPT